MRKIKLPVQEITQELVIDLINGQTRKLFCEHYIYSTGDSSESVFPVNYSIKPEKIISWRSFKRKLNKMKVDGPIIVYYMTHKKPYPMYERDLHVARINVKNDWKILLSNKQTRL